MSGLSLKRFFTTAGISPYDEVEWTKRTALITNAKGETIFEQKDIEAPASWSQTAVDITSSKYFYGKQGTPAREGSIRGLVARVVDTITGWGAAGGYFADDASMDTFRDELAHLMLTQKAAFNSPVWFNVGVPRNNYGWVWDNGATRKVRDGEHKPQCSACFINSVEDTMESILDLAKTEGMIFKSGSGSGTNLSTLREEGGALSAGGRSSGPLSFMKGLDAFAGAIKSGGKTRRAAIMRILNADHPDVEKFIWCKSSEEKKAHALVDAGYDSAIDGEAYGSVFYQNANCSVRVTGGFMARVVADAEWTTKSVKDGEPVKIYKARDLLREMAKAAHLSGDPGIQFDTTINDWHTVPMSGRINSSNPCSEYMHLDDTACNLASINLIKFANADCSFDVAAFRAAVNVMIIAQEILVDSSTYPTERIASKSHTFRPLGLGYANLGALLMSLGLAYDSDAGREWAASITSIMCGQAYITSGKLAQAVDACDGVYLEGNEKPFLDVISKHRNAALCLKGPLALQAKTCWDNALHEGRLHGYRNCQVTVLAPTGTIGFMMDVATTGVEPELALVKHKKLVGGGVIKSVNSTVPAALKKLGYNDSEAHGILDHIDLTGTIEGAPHIKDEHLPVFDCSFRAQNGVRSIHHMGHVKMMAAVQPFLSGAISKTVNMPEEATVEDIENVYIESWKLGLKSVAVYRNNSKRSQPLNAGGKGVEVKAVVVAPSAPVAPLSAQRRKLPEERKSITHRFIVGGHKGYLTVGLYPDGTPGELFIQIAKEGSTVSGLMTSFGHSISYALQYGVPLQFFVDKFSHMRFEPSGWTGNPDVPYAKSIIDYIFRWLGARFPTAAQHAPVVASLPAPGVDSAPVIREATDAPYCSNCGCLMSANGSCFKCDNCGGTTGC